MKRKVIQILYAPRIGDDNYSVLYALCDDGTIWWKNERMGAPWQRDDEIPQENQ